MDAAIEFETDVYFDNALEVKQYEDHIKHKVISNIFCCDLFVLNDFPCITFLELHNLNTFFKLNEPVFPNLIGTFYTNMKFPTSVAGAFKSKVLGQSFTVTPKLVNRLLGTTRQESVCAGLIVALRNLPPSPRVKSWISSSLTLSFLIPFRGSMFLRKWISA